jgi:8-oxo-dGTP diphosphatase
MNVSELNKVNLNPHVSVDCVILGYDSEELKVLLIERKYTEDNGDGQPHNPKLDIALPGNLVRDDEDLDTSAKRILKELTGLDNIYMEQFRAFGNPNRVRKEQDAEWLKTMRTDPQARVITIAYFALVKLEDYVPRPDSFARRSEWYPIKKLPKLAFDHNEILEQALQVLKFKVTHYPLGFELLPEKFSLGQLQRLYESILGDDLDKRNFRRKMKSLKLLIPLKEKQQGVAHKPAELYMFNMKVYEQLQKGLLK